MTVIKDSVHDHIAVDGVALDLLDTPPLQRLRRISQLGTVSLVYPSANHTRFEHSLGVYHLARRALEHLGVRGSRAATVEAAALCHDVGHGPFSHTLEALIHRHTGRYHDEVAHLIETDPIASVLEDHDVSPRTVARLIAGEGRHGGLVSGDLDVDRMDYLVRDAHHTGVPYGTIDTGRLVTQLRLVDGDLVLEEGNVQTAESLLVARALMNPTVYRHPVARISKAMLRRAAARLVDSGSVDAAALARMDDMDLVVTLRRSEETAALVEHLDTRQLYKRALWAELPDVPEGLLEADHERIRTLERSIADSAGVADEAVVLDVPSRPRMRESSTTVLVNGEVRRLDRQSPLVQALRDATATQWRLGVYSPAAHRDAVGRAAVSTLGLDIDGPLVAEGPRGLSTTLDEFLDGTPNA